MNFSNLNLYILFKISSLHILNVQCFPEMFACVSQRHKTACKFRVKYVFFFAFLREKIIIFQSESFT
jgi:hypothetical protein